MKFAVWPCLLGLLIPAFAGTSAAQTVATKDIVGAYAKAAIQNGQAIGVGVAVIHGHAVPKLFTFGNSFVGSGATPSRLFQSSDLFQIASVTKVFTTNLLGQAVRKNRVSLDDPLSHYTAQLGTLEPLTRQVTLKELADFTGGIDDLAPLCTQDPVPGCLPSGRPDISHYSAGDFVRFFRHTVPYDFTQSSPVPAAEVPAPYSYSNYGVGLLGLLLASRDGKLSNGDLKRWFDKVQDEILTPLGMNDTYLNVPTEQAPRLAGGYQQALARAQVANGQVSSITLSDTGANYTQAPAIHIRGGGGTGARATATLSGHKVGSVTLTRGGSGYLTPAKITLTNGGSTATASAQIIVDHGQVVVIAMNAGGAGYVRAPTVTITGGRAESGRDATATAQIVNGRVAYLTIVDPGDGYVTPLSVVIDPGNAATNAIPIWAPAGALTTTLTDLGAFTRAALLAQQPGSLVPRAVAQGFAIAETPYACGVGSDPDLSACPAGAMQSGLSWAVQPADDLNGIPAVISKDGSLPGFSTFIVLMPTEKIAVAVMVNSRSPQTVSGTVPAAAATLANNILYTMFAACQSPGGCPH